MTNRARHHPDEQDRISPGEQDRIFPGEQDRTSAWFTPGQSIDEWINEADKKLYDGKMAGKNRVVL